MSLSSVEGFDHFVNAIQYVFKANHSLYDIEFETIDNQIQTLKAFEDKIVLIVNTASLCKLNTQFEALETLYQKYKEHLIIIAFACNQFGELEPRNNEELKEFYKNHDLHYMFGSKIEVNGANAHPLFRYLKNKTSHFMESSTIEWNFTKFLIAPYEKSVKRYSSMTQPMSLEYDIQNILIKI